MRIDGINIATYGLMLVSSDGIFSLPARKKILAYPIYTAAGIKHEAKEIKIDLVGIYTTEAALVSNIELFKTKVKSLLDHTWYLIIDNETFTGVVASGIKVKITRSTAQLSFTITKT